MKKKITDWQDDPIILRELATVPADVRHAAEVVRRYLASTDGRKLLYGTAAILAGDGPCLRCAGIGIPPKRGKR